MATPNGAGGLAQAVANVPAAPSALSVENADKRVARPVGIAAADAKAVTLQITEDKAERPSPHKMPPPQNVQPPSGAREMYSIHGEQAARRRAIGELIFFAGVNDLRRCRQIASTWNIRAKDPTVMDYDRRTPLHVSAAEGAYSVVQWLIQEENADVNCISVLIARHWRRLRVMTTARWSSCY